MRMGMGAVAVAAFAVALGCNSPESPSMATDGPNQVVLKVPSMT